MILRHRCLAAAAAAAATLALFAAACAPATPPATPTNAPVAAAGGPDADPGPTAEELHRGFEKGCDQKIVGAEYCACAWEQMQLTFSPADMRHTPLDPALLETFKGRTKQMCLKKLPERTVKANFVRGCDGAEDELAPYCECVWGSYRTTLSVADLSEDKITKDPRIIAATKVAVKTCGAQAGEAPAKKRFVTTCAAANSALTPFCECAWKTLRKDHGPAEVLAGTFGIDTLDAILTKACGTLKVSQ